MHGYSIHLILLQILYMLKTAVYAHLDMNVHVLLRGVILCTVFFGPNSTWNNYNH